MATVAVDVKVVVGTEGGLEHDGGAEVDACSGGDVFGQLDAEPFFSDVGVVEGGADIVAADRADVGVVGAGGIAGEVEFAAVVGGRRSRCHRWRFGRRRRCRRRR